MRTFNTLAQIVESLNHFNGKIADDHNSTGTMRKVTGVALLNRGDVQIPVSFCDASYFSLNKIYLGEGNETRISTDSVGGVIKLMNGVTLLEGILNYNAEQATNLFSPSFLSDIHILKDDKLEPVDLVTHTQVRVMQNACAKAHAAKYPSKEAARVGVVEKIFDNSEVKVIGTPNNTPVILKI